MTIAYLQEGKIGIVDYFRIFAGDTYAQYGSCRWHLLVFLFLLV